MKMWKRYVVSALAIVMVAAMSFYLPRIYGEAAQEEPTAETEPVETEPLETEPSETVPLETEPIETEPPETLDNAGGATDDNMNPPKLTLVPRELTDEENEEKLCVDLWKCARACSLTNAEGETLQIRDCAVSGDMPYESGLFTVGIEIWTYYFKPSSYHILSGDIGTDRIMFSWGGDSYECLKGSGISNVLLTRDGLSLEGTNMRCEIYRNEKGSDHKTILRTENASRAVLKYEDGQFLLWSDGAYSIEVYDNWSGATLLGKEVEADSVFCVQDVSSAAPTCHRVDTAE